MLRASRRTELATPMLCGSSPHDIHRGERAHPGARPHGAVRAFWPPAAAAPLSWAFPRLPPGGLASAGPHGASRGEPGAAVPEGQRPHSFPRGREPRGAREEGGRLPDGARGEGGGPRARRLRSRGAERALGRLP